MGKIPWDVIRRNVPNGGLIACRVPTDHLIVAGVSNWGAYALAAGVALLARGETRPVAVRRGTRARTAAYHGGEGAAGGRRDRQADRLRGRAAVRRIRQAAASASRIFWGADDGRPAKRDGGRGAAGGAARRMDRADGGAGARLRPGQPRRRAARPGLRLPALLPAQPEAVPAAGRDRTRFAGAALGGARRPTCAPTSRATASTATANWWTSRPTCSRWRRDDLVGFLLGCSFTFENALLEAGVPVRHIEQGRNVPMYRTNIACRPAGRSAGRWSCRCGR